MQANKNNNVQQKLENLSLEPSGKVWEEIEQSLKKRKRRYLIAWWWPLMLLPAALWLYWGWQPNNQEAIPADNKQQASTGTLQSPEKPVTTQLLKKDPSVKNNMAVPAEKDNNALQAKVNTVKISPRKKDRHLVSGNDEKITGSNKMVFSDRSLTKVKITNGSLEEAMPFAEEDLHNRESTGSIPVDAGDSLVISGINDSLSAITNNTTANKKTPALPVVKRSDDHKTDKNKWNTRVIAHAGRAVFSHSGNEDPTSPYFSPNTGTSGSSSTTYQEYIPGSGISLGIGIEKEKKLSEKISFSAGLSYNFSNIEIEGTVYTYSVTIQNGMPVYSNVTSISGSSRLSMHSLDASLLVHYRLSGNKFPLRLSAGIYNRVLFAGNWNHYKNVLGKKPGYMPLLHLNPSVYYKKLTAGPYLQLGLTKIAGGYNLFGYGLGVKYDVP